MGSRKSTPLELGNLRRRAEQRLEERKSRTSMPAPDPLELLHELEVHQIELEIQNEELLEARVELESALALYTEIFDFAPIGYVTLALDGSIRAINHAGARLLCSTRSQLLQRGFGSLVTPAHRTQFSDLLRRALVSESRESCELELLRLGASNLEVTLIATLLARVEPLVLLAMETLSDGSSRTELAGPESHVAPTRAPGAAGQH